MAFWRSTKHEDGDVVIDLVERLAPYHVDLTQERADREEAEREAAEGDRVRRRSSPLVAPAPDTPSG